MLFNNSGFGYDMRVGYYHNNRNNNFNRYRTGCCALGQLSLSDDHTLEEIQEILDLIKLENNIPVDRTRRNGGERAIFVTTLPDEEKLEENLTKLGFKMIYEFHRRNYAPEDSMLKMWIISW